MHRNWLRAGSSSSEPPEKRRRAVEDSSSDEWPVVRPGLAGSRCGTWAQSSSDEETALAAPVTSPAGTNPVVTVALDARSLQLHAGLGGARPRECLSRRDKLGMDASRVHTLLTSGSCGCQSRCFGRLQQVENDIVEVLRWWFGHLDSSERTFLLSTLYDSVGRSPQASGSRLTTRWMLAGVPICRTGLRKVLGMGATAFVRLTHGASSLKSCRNRPSPQTDRVNQYFLELYMSAAEPLPHESYMVRGTTGATHECEA